MNKSLKQQSKLSIIHESVNIEGILTQRTCADILIEIIKVLSHQKLQIPYSYEVLRYLVDKKKDSSSQQNNKNGNWQLQKHFHTISTALGVLETIFKNVILEMERPDYPEEVYIILGVTPTSPKEVFKVILPENLHFHYHENHARTARNVVLSTLRKITTSSELSKTIYHPIQPTSMFLLLSRRQKHGEAGKAYNRTFSEFFNPVQSIKISPRVVQTVIDLKYEAWSVSNCCEQMVIFDDFKLKCSLNDDDNIFTDNISPSKVFKLDASNTNTNINSLDKDEVHETDNILEVVHTYDKTCTNGSDVTIVETNFNKMNILESDNEVTTACESKSLSRNISVKDASNIHMDLSLETREWYQASLVLKGFKDCFINGESIINSWGNS